jgi:hypothetical protein
LFCFHFPLASINEKLAILVFVEPLISCNRLSLVRFSSKRCNYILLNGWINFTTYIHHIFFIHSSVDGYLGWFCNLTVVNSATINMDMQVSYSELTLIPLGIFPEVIW